MNINQIFPEGLTPRNNQAEIIKETINAIKRGKRFIVIEAPTGFGKSMVALSLANYYDKVYIVCSTNYLQEQYIENFEKYFNKSKSKCVMKGRSNYDCAEADDDGITTCADGICNIMKNNCNVCAVYHKDTCNLVKKNPDACITCDKMKTYCSKGTNVKDIKENTYYECNYCRLRSKFIGSDVGILNYDMLFLDNINPMGLYKQKTKDIIIMDEAHNLDKKVMDYFGININYKSYRKVIKNLMSYEEFKIIENYNLDDDYDGIIDYLNYVFDLTERYLYNNTDVKKVKKIKKLHNEVGYQLEMMRTDRENGSLYNHIIDEKKHEGDGEPLKLIIKPLKLNMAKSLIEKSESKAFVFMSATFNGYEDYFEELGIKRSEIEYIEGNSDYPFEDKNPVYKAYKSGSKYSLSSKNINNNPNCDAMESVYNYIRYILKMYPDVKGLIHTRSKTFAEWINDNVKDDRLLFYTDKEEKEEVTNYFKANPKDNKVLVSYSHTEGVDFADDLCRFQIICKIPYPIMDKRYEIKLFEGDWPKRNREWRLYNLDTIRTLIQTLGRGYRSKDDYCVNYILDNRLESMIYKYGEDCERLLRQLKGDLEL